MAAAGTRTRLYHMIEGIGRWSMIDVFMISILVALIQMARIATIEPGVGAVCFAAVVDLDHVGDSRRSTRGSSGTA